MILLDGHTISIDDIAKISRFHEKVKLHASSVSDMNQSLHFVEEIVHNESSVYGINTGFGPLSHTRIQKKELAQHQLNLLHHLSVGQGDLFNQEETRAIITSRINALARGFSGIRPLVVKRLIDFLNFEIFPEIPYFP